MSTEAHNSLNAVSFSRRRRLVMLSDALTTLVAWFWPTIKVYGPSGILTSDPFGYRFPGIEVVNPRRMKAILIP